MLSDEQQATAAGVASIIEKIAQITCQLNEASHQVDDVAHAKMQMNVAVVQLTALGQQLSGIQDRLARSAPNLLTIPRELRDRIYDYLEIVDWRESPPFLMYGYDGPWVGKERADIYRGLTLTCHQLHDEVVKLFWSKNVFLYNPPGIRKSQMADDHLQLIRNWEVCNGVQAAIDREPITLTIAAWKGEIECYSHVWKVSDQKLALIEKPFYARYPGHLFPPVAEKAIPILETLQNATLNGQVMSWKTLHGVYESIEQLSIKSE